MLVQEENGNITILICLSFTGHTPARGNFHPLAPKEISPPLQLWPVKERHSNLYFVEKNDKGYRKAGHMRFPCCDHSGKR